VSQAFLARWYIGGGYVDVSEVVVFYDWFNFSSFSYVFFCAEKNIL
jgi:hypothetical protein